MDDEPHSAGPPDRDDPVEALVVECLARYEEEGEAALEAVLREHPARAPDLRARLERLREVGLLGLTAPASDGYPERLGGFRLLRRIGGGGMGVVFLAQQESPERQVALKAVRPDQLFFPGARERFRREVEAVARLQHPGIVPVYSAGEDRGVPFFTMEHVDGRSLAEVLRALHGRRAPDLSGADLAATLLPPASDDGSRPPSSRGSRSDVFRKGWVEGCARIALQVAEALEHAHARGVVHRDVKPANILLTPDGRALLFDFGLASARDADSMTRTGALLGSLPYMAPEQVAGESADERSDVYALGVTLYELLTLRLPFEGGTPELVQRRILEGQPEPPRRLNPVVPRDVETVCLTAMERERERRYASAGALAEELRRVLELRPIAARRPTAALRARRWVQRHPAATLGVLLALLLVVVAPSAFALMQLRSSRRIQQQRDLSLAAQARAEANLARAWAAVDVFLRKVGASHLEDVPQMEGLRRELLEEAAAFYEELLAQEADDPARQREVAEAFQQLSLVQDLLGDEEAGDEARARWREHLEALGAGTRDDPGLSDALAGVLNNQGVAAQRTGRGAEAAAHYREGIALLEPLVAAGAPLEASLARLVNNLAYLDFEGSRHAPALEGGERSLALLEPLLEHGRSRDVLEELARAHSTAGLACEYLGRGEQALEHFHRSAELWDEVLAQVPSDSDVRRNAALAWNQVGRTLTQQAGRASDGLLHLERAVELQQELVDAFPLAPGYRFDLAQSLNNLAIARENVGEADAAQEPYDRAIEAYRVLVEDAPDNAGYRSELGGALSNLGDLLVRRGQEEQARELALEAIDQQREALRLRPQHPVARKFLAIHHGVLADACLRLGRYAEAADAVDANLELIDSPQGALWCLAKMAACLGAAEADARLAAGERDALAEGLTRRALGLLDVAMQRGVLTLEDLEQAEELESLRARPELFDWLDEHASR